MEQSGANWQCGKLLNIKTRNSKPFRGRYWPINQHNVSQTIQLSQPIQHTILLPAKTNLSSIEISPVAIWLQRHACWHIILKALPKGSNDTPEDILFLVCVAKRLQRHAGRPTVLVILLFWRRSQKAPTTLRKTKARWHLLDGCTDFRLPPKYALSLS